MLLLVALGLAGALMQEGATVSGRVLEAGTLAPVVGAQVMLMVQFQGPPPMALAYRPKTATTDNSGRFVFVDVEPGRYRLRSQKSGFAMPLTDNGLALELNSGDRRDNVEITLQRGGVITGRVVDESGEPVVDARVMVLRKPPLPPRAAPAAAARFANRLMPAGAGAQTNDLGEFRLHSLLSGEYYVQAAPRGDFGGGPAAVTPATTTMVPTYFPGTPDPLAAQPIVVTAGQTAADVVVRMVTAAAFQVSGVVVDEAGQPVGSVMVRLRPQDAAGIPVPMAGPFTQVRTDTRGAFAFPNVTNGAYTLIAVPAVVIAGGSPGSPGSGATTGALAWSSTAGGSGRGAGGGAVTIESRNGTTLQYRDDAGTQLPVVVNQDSVTGLQVVVHRPSGR